MSHDANPPLQPQPPRERPRPIAWFSIIGVVLLGILTIVLLALVLGRDDDGTATTSPTPSASASAASPEGSASAAPQASAAASAAPSAGSTVEPTAIALDTIVETIAEGVAIRAEAGLDGERLGSLEIGSPSYVVAGPSDADGYRWYLVSGLGLPPSSGCAGPAETDPYNCPAWFGWVAAASESGEPWLAPAETDCPAMPVAVEDLVVGRTDLQRLACFGSEPFVFRGWWPEIPEDAGLGGACPAEDEPSGWLLCNNINYNYVTVDESEGMGGLGVQVFVDPASGVTMPERNTWLELRVHLDDPAAQGCDDAAQAFEQPDRPPEQYVLECRARLVVESVTAVDGP